MSTPASLRKPLVDAIAAALGVATVGSYTKPSGLTIDRMRKLPVQGDSLPRTGIWLGNENVTGEASSRVQREVQVFLEHRATHPSSDGDAALDPVYAWGVIALLADITLGGKCSNVEEVSTDWEEDEMASAFAAALTEFKVTYFTAYNDPGTAS